MKGKRNLTIALLLGLLFVTAITVLHPASPSFSEDSYTVIDGDCLSIIAEKLSTSVDSIKSANNLDSDDLQIGQRLVIPGSASYYGYADADSTYTDDSYSYTVAQGDSLWLIAGKLGTSVDSIRSANNLDSDDLQVGQLLLVASNFSSDQPISRGNVVRPVVETKGNDYGELVDWSLINGLFPIGSNATLQDFETGRTFKIHHLFGENHADCEPLTAQDASIMKQCFGGEWSWARRAAIIWLDGRPIACSMAGMPHGTSQDINGNDFDGMFDLHFLNSRTHGTNSVDPDHQAMVRRAAGL